MGLPAHQRRGQAESEHDGSHGRRHAGGHAAFDLIQGAARRDVFMAMTATTPATSV